MKERRRVKFPSFRKKPQPDAGFITVNGEPVPFAVVRSKKRKRTIAFRMEQDASLRVLAPASASIGFVTRFLESRAPWVAQRLAERRAVGERATFADGSRFMYLGHACTLRVTQGLSCGDAPFCKLLPWRIHVHVPSDKLAGNTLRDEVRLELTLWLRKRARRLLKRRLDLWAARMDLDYKKLIVTDPAQRWGSCSADNIIRLNWRLMLAPLAILDYVVAHELCHVRHKNHSARFWSHLARFMPDSMGRRRALRRIERELVI
jgi:predicted metal-dependent hydrolase